VLLIAIGLLAGFVTAISPCVLPVLPIVLVGGATGRKPFRIIAGLVASFVVFTLFAAWILDRLGLPQDLLRDIAIAMLFLVAATLLFPELARLIERPFARLSRYRAGGGGFLLGASLGLVFVPCAGPALAAISSAAGATNFGWRTLVLAIAYGVGAGIPMVAVAFGGPRVATRLRLIGPRLRLVSGVVVLLATLGIVLHGDEWLQKKIPDYTGSLQKVEKSASAQRELAKLSGGAPLVAKQAAKGAASDLPDYGPAPEVHADGDWFNSKPLTMHALRGKVVLVDFWTYSCINCLRTLPHLEAWDAAYRGDGLVVLGVHTPEFAFEHEASNVRAAIARLGIRYPVLQDNRFRTWQAYANQYWPAEYMVDRSGHVRHVHFGEGKYEETESLLRQLLGVDRGSTTDVADTTPLRWGTPESYLGYARLARYAGSPIAKNISASYRFPARLAADELAYDGRWRVEAERIVSVADARLRLRFNAKNVFLVLGGKGRVDVSVDGRPTRVVDVDAYKLYTLRQGPKFGGGLLELRFTPGVEAYAFTFG